MGVSRDNQVPRITLRVPGEASESLGVSPEFFDEHVRHELRLIRRGRLLLVPVAELTAWAERESALVLPEAA
jgi:hypothetical protein